MSIDQGTSSTRAIVFDTDSQIVSVAQLPFKQHYPNDGWVEHDPEDIWGTSLQVSQQALQEAESGGHGEVVAIGITNQRETTLVWGRKDLKPIYNAIVWQDRRTAKQCEVLKGRIKEEALQAKTGLLLDPYFSASKVAWILDHVDGAREQSEDLAFGTVDTFLLSRLTNGKEHATDATNASRTNLFNIQTYEWDDELLELFNVPKAILPEVKDSADNFGMTDEKWFGREIPVLSMAGDQQAALIGQCGFNFGDTKSTYGTGCFVINNTGDKFIQSKQKLLSTIAYRIKGKTTYGLEGSIFNAGTTMQWLRDEMEMIDDVKETEAIAKNLDSNNGVYLVPAFTGMGAPYWSPDTRGLITGLTRDSRRNHIIRAGLESVCYQTHDLLKAMEAEGVDIQTLKIDGGMVGNSWLAQFLSDIIGVVVQRPKVMETTALGVAYLAGLQAGLFDSLDAIQGKWQLEKEFTSNMTEEHKENLLTAWQKAMRQTLAI